MSDERARDPEVVEDELLRRRSLHDKTRSGDPGPFQSAQIVDKVPCRARCGTLADWPQEAEDAFVIWNRKLESDGETPIDKTRVSFCGACTTLGKGMQGDRNRKAVEAMREAIGGLKNSNNPRNERALITKIERIGHPDIHGLLEAIEISRKAPGKARRSSEIL